MANKLLLLAVTFGISVAGILCAQEGPLDPNSSIQFNLPPNSPVSMMSASYGDSRATVRGGALVLDLHISLTLRNQDPKRIRAITVLISAQDSAPGGRASYSVPTLDVRPGETFPLKIDVQLIRPVQSASGPLVQVSLDGVLFEGLQFFGPNKLNSRRTMTFWEMQNQRDRAYLKQVLSTKGAVALQQEMLASFNRQTERPGLDVQVNRGARAVGAAAARPEHLTSFAFLNVPSAPVELIDGWADISGNEARDARIHLDNRSRRAVKYVEVGWIVKDSAGREFMAGSLPSAESDMYLPPGQRGEMLQDTTLKFSQGRNKPVAIASMTGFVSQVEFSDGGAWVPTREALGNSHLGKLLSPSPEEQRLTDLYKKKGLAALLQDLNRN